MHGRSENGDRTITTNQKWPAFERMRAIDEIQERNFSSGTSNVFVALKSFFCASLNWQMSG